MCSLVQGCVELGSIKNTQTRHPNWGGSTLYFEIPVRPANTAGKVIKTKAATAFI